MVLVYSLLDALIDDPQWVANAQSLTLNRDRPYIGLKGNHGLFGSEEWVNNIKNGVISKFRRSGIIVDIRTANLDDPEDICNTAKLCVDDGSEFYLSFYFNNSDQEMMYKIGKKITMEYILDERKFWRDESDRFLNLTFRVLIER